MTFGLKTVDNKCNKCLQKSEDLYFPAKMDIISKKVEKVCEHLFCDVCINVMFLVNNQCINCQKTFTHIKHKDDIASPIDLTFAKRYKKNDISKKSMDDLDKYLKRGVMKEVRDFETLFNEYEQIIFFADLLRDQFMSIDDKRKLYQKLHLRMYYLSQNEIICSTKNIEKKIELIEKALDALHEIHERTLYNLEVSFTSNTLNI